jgi:hypothetical protein
MLLIYPPIGRQGVAKMRRGDRVKLVNQVAESFTKKNPLSRINWGDRRGTVVRISRGSDTVAVQWDNRPSPDGWPIRASKSLLQL